MSFHTPGTWLPATRASSVVGLPIVASPSGRSIASVTFFGLGKGFQNHEQESYANARLIAAAPDMLAELDVRVGDLFMLRKAIEANDPKTELLFRIDDMLRETKAAIAKAVQS